MAYLLALVAAPGADSAPAQLATEAQRVAIRNDVDVVTLAELDTLPGYRADLDTEDGRPLIANQLRRSTLEADGVLLFADEATAVPALAESVIAWLTHAGSGPAPAIAGKPVAVITAGPGEVVNQDMADRLRAAGADVVADGVSITGSWSDPATITRLGDTVVAVASSAS
ncbi:NAD(P)H-dependent oxidoreductase [Nocardia sp. NPDC050718]|uniref:NADPH-dependent FMN reductase n=1 Tax=Nocardia sp. NPDC050718 TaxID=3155788 RepID=UPI0033E34BE0